MTKPDPVALAPDCRPSASRRPGSCRRAAAPPAHAIVERRVPGRALMGAHVEIGRPNDVVAAPFHLPLRKPGASIVRAERLHLVEDDEIGIPEIGIGRIVLRDHDRVVEYPPWTIASAASCSDWTFSGKRNSVLDMSPNFTPATRLMAGRTCSRSRFAMTMSAFPTIGSGSRGKAAIAVAAVCCAPARTVSGEVYVCPLIFAPFTCGACGG